MRNKIVFFVKNNHGLKNIFIKGIKLINRVGIYEGCKRAIAHFNATQYDHMDIYLEWIKKCEPKNSIGLTPQKTPLISIVMPVYNAEIKWLIEAIESVRTQIYSNWELCIADDCSTKPEIIETLRRYEKLDQKIKVVYRTKNGHISAASNSALELASGEWVALLDQDDLLPSAALLCLASAIEMNPSAQLIYSDEDKINEKGERFSPYFKSDWNPDLFYSHNMFSHLGCYKTSLLKEIGGFREGYEGAQDYDLALRCIEKISPTQIKHIPRVLYHWRVHAESTSSGADAKPYAMLAGERAINDHLKRTNKRAFAQLVGPGYRVKYSIPDPQPLVSVIIPTKNNLALIKKCIESLLSKTKYSNYEVIIVDNGSNDPSTLQYLDWLSGNPKIKILVDPEDFNYSRLNNNAIKIANGTHVALLNDDVEIISPDWLEEMISHSSRNEVGVVGAKLWYPNNTIQHAGLLLGVGGIANSSHLGLPRGAQDYFSRTNLIQSFSAVTGACLVVKKSIYEAVGGLDEKNLKISFNDVDFCLKTASLGLRNIFTPYAELYHHESASRGYDNNTEKTLRLLKEAEYIRKKWRVILDNDPAYNPNLSREKMDFSLNFNLINDQGL